MAKVELKSVEVDMSSIRSDNGKLLSSSILDIENQLRFAIGELSLYRQENNLDIDEFENIEVSLHKALNEVEMIK